MDAAKQQNATAEDHLRAALAYRYSGDEGHAKQEFDRALALDPDLWEARIAAAEVKSTR
jgi:Tfp pilus assembly protein PilF